MMNRLALCCTDHKVLARDKTMADTKISIVEDDRGVGALLKCMLSREGLAADVHMTATGFLEDYSPQDPGCLVLDVRLPDMDGIELLRECRRRGWSAPAIILTAYGNVSSAVEIGRAHV